MIDVKVSIPNESKELNFSNFLNPDDKRLSKVNFHINKSIEKADYWFVFEDLESENQKCKVPFENIVYLNTETSFKKNYFFENHIRHYVNQFGQVYSCYATDHANTTNTYPFLPWMIHSKYGSSVLENSKLNYQTLKKNIKNKKEIKLSVICSNKRNTENHILRIEFLNILKKYFGDEILWNGQGFKDISTKSEIIFDSKYHLVLENDSRFNLMSEKLFDSFLGLSYPIYYGAPNINSYFDPQALSRIDINDIGKSIQSIEKIINSELYETNLDKLIDSKNLVLNEYNFISRILDIIFKNSTNSGSDIVHELYSKNYFWNNHTSSKKKLKSHIKRKLRID